MMCSFQDLDIVVKIEERDNANAELWTVTDNQYKIGFVQIESINDQRYEIVKEEKIVLVARYEQQ